MRCGDETISLKDCIFWLSFTIWGGKSKSAQFVDINSKTCRLARVSIVQCFELKAFEQCPFQLIYTCKALHKFWFDWVWPTRLAVENLVRQSWCVLRSRVLMCFICATGIISLQLSGSEASVPAPIHTFLCCFSCSHWDFKLPVASQVHVNSSPKQSFDTLSEDITSY